MHSATAAPSPLKVWLITVGEPLPVNAGENPRLLRTGRLARYLHDRGHAVLWWTSAFDHFAKRHYTPDDATMDWEGGQLRLLRSTGYKSNVSIARFVDHAGVARKFSREARRLPSPDVILVSLPTVELAHAAVEFGRARGVPVLVDIRDLWPDLIIDVVPPSWRWLSRLLLTGMVRQARQAMSRCDGLVAVSEGYLQWGLRYARRTRHALDATIPLGYVAPPARRTEADVGQQMASLGVRQGAALCWYVGTFGRQYDLGPVIDAARMFHAAGRSDVQFVISGEGELGPRWTAQAAGLGNVVFTGWIGADEINWLRANAAIGLQPYVAGAPQGLANKLFEYLSAGLPVVSSLSGENEALIARHNCGFTYQAGDGADCARRLNQLLNDPALRQAMGDNGKRLFEQQYDGRAVFETLVAHLETVARNGARKIQPMTNFVEVTELAGDEVAGEQVERVQTRYAWALGFCAGKDVLEVACGTGPGLGLLKSAARSLVAGDISDEILQRARAHYGDRIDIRRMDAMALPFADESLDVVIIFEALYYVPDAERFVAECARVLRPGGRVLVSNANKDLFDFNASPHSHVYHGVVELGRLFGNAGFSTEFWGDVPVSTVSWRQKILRPIKTMVVSLGLMPKSMAGKKLLKRLVFGQMQAFPKEISNSPTLNADRLFKLPAATADRSHKVVLCAATLRA